MAATTITRSTWTNDTGTPALPVGDGTIINNARLQEIYANIDALIGAAITFGGTISTEGFGVHSFSAGGAGNQNLIVRNTSAGAANSAEVSVGNNANSAAGRIVHTSSTYTPSAPFLADSFTVIGTRPGGVAVGAIDASGSLRLWAGSAQRVTIGSGGQCAFGGAAIDTNNHYLFGGTFTAASGASATNLVTINGTVTAAGATSIAGLFLTPTLGLHTTGTHGNVAGLWLQPPAVTANGAAVTKASTLLVNGPPTVSGAQNLAIQVSSGQSSFGAGSVSAPAVIFNADGDTGFYQVTANEVGLATAGVYHTRWALATYPFMGLQTGAFGAGVGGCEISVGRNSSGAGAAGKISFTMLNGSARWVWVDATGDLQIHTSPPVEASGDTSGTVVGDQTSTRRTKRCIRRFRDVDAALALIARTPLYRFRYREGGDRDTDHVGILAEASPAFTRRRGQSFDPINAFGYTAAAIQALLGRLEQLEARA